MSIRVYTTDTRPGILVGNRGLGVKGRDIPSDGDAGPALAYPFISLPADNDVEFSVEVLTWPSAGTLFVYDDSSFSYSGAPDGSYEFTWRLRRAGAVVGTYTTALVVGEQGTSVVTRQLDGAFGVAGAVGASLPGAFAVASPVGAALPGAFGVAGAVGAQLPGAFEVVQDGSVSASLAGAYAVAGTVSASLAGSYGITQALMAQLAGEFDVRGAVGAELAGGYAVAAAVGASLAGAYAVAGAGGGVADPAQVWAHVLPNGKSAAQTLMDMEQMVLALYRIHGLEPGTALRVSKTLRTAGPIEQTISTAGEEVTVERV